jgi:metal-sulfur cluster biosynthetic enzyme
MTDDIVSALKTVYDPEIPVDIYELGLIYKVDIDDDRNVAIEMTLTAPGCPVAGDMPGWVGECRFHRAGRGERQGDHRLRPAVGPQPNVG